MAEDDLTVWLDEAPVFISVDTTGDFSIWLDDAPVVDAVLAEPPVPRNRAHLV